MRLSPHPGLSYKIGLSRQTDSRGSAPFRPAPPKNALFKKIEPYSKNSIHATIKDLQLPTEKIMPINEIEKLAGVVGLQILTNMKLGDVQCHALVMGENNELVGYPERVYKHRGIYGFRLTIKGKTTVSYIGKSEGNQRLRQHLTGRNINGKLLAKSVGHQNANIKDAIELGFIVHLCLYASEDFKKSSISCIEISTALMAKSEMQLVFPDIQHWNRRIG